MTALGDYMKINMKQAHHSDIEFLQKLRNTTMNEYLAKLGLPIDDSSNLKSIKEHFEAANILYIYDKPIGLFKYYEDEKTVYIKQVEIMPEYQGKKIGESILKDLQAQAKLGSKNIDLHVLKSSPAKHLYERLGFNVVSQNDNEFIMQYKSEL